MLFRSVHAAAAGNALAEGLRDPADSLPEQHALTLSVGVTVMLDGEPFKVTLARADAALYAAKAAGRDQVVTLAPPLQPQKVLAAY